jgi:hypothetical protein
LQKQITAWRFSIPAERDFFRPASIAAHATSNGVGDLGRSEDGAAGAQMPLWKECVP